MSTTPFEDAAPAIEPEEAAALSVVARQVAEVTGDGCIIQLLTPNQRELRVVAWHHATPALQHGLDTLIHELGVISRGDVRLLSAVIDQQRTVRIAGPLKDALQVGGITSTTLNLFVPVQHLLGLPLVARGKVLGLVLVFRARSDAPHTEAEESLVQALADRASLALDDARRSNSLPLLPDAQARLRQDEKMDAIGQLAGTVAHDFNNMLTAILSFATFVEEDLPADHPSRSDVREIIAAGERASALSRQLLTFSGRQVTQPRVQDLNTLIRSAEPAIRNVLGDNIEWVTELSSDVAVLEIDSASLEQVLMNLAANARDAMPKGGRFSIETRNVTRGDQSSVRLQITDTGVGMAPDTLARAFEPFFSTKIAGGRPGLGLSLVYGIVKQSGGEMLVESAPGQGTTFQILWPRVPSAVEARARTTAMPSLSGTETVLVVEGDELVRTAAKRALSGHGYEVLEAGQAEAALTLCRQHVGSIHLLVTDVVLPQMSGGELVQQLMRFRPQLRVLFMADPAQAIPGAGEKKIERVQKPFTPDALLQKVRRTLDATAETR